MSPPLVTTRRRAMDSLPLTTAQQPAQGGAKRFVGFGLTLCAGALLGAAVSRSAAPAQQKSDTSHAGVTPIPSLGGALEQIPTGIGSDLNEGFKANPLSMSRTCGPDHTSPFLRSRRTRSTLTRTCATTSSCR